METAPPVLTPSERERRSRRDDLHGIVESCKQPLLKSPPPLLLFPGGPDDDSQEEMINGQFGRNVAAWAG